MNDINESLKLRRVLAHLPQWRVAALAGIPQPILSMIETGRRVPSQQLAQRIEDAIRQLAREGGET